jgi:hypothetical protein
MVFLHDVVGVIRTDGVTVDVESAAGVVVASDELDYAVKELASLETVLLGIDLDKSAVIGFIRLAHFDFHSSFSPL